MLGTFLTISYAKGHVCKIAKLNTAELTYKESKALKRSQKTYPNFAIEVSGCSKYMCKSFYKIKTSEFIKRRMG